MGKLAKDLLASSKVTTVLVEPLMSIFGKIRTDTSERTAEVVEIISDLRCPLVTEKESQVCWQIE